MNEQRLLERFLRYVQVDTTAKEGAATSPSSPGQLALGRIVADELRQAGIEDVVQDQHGIVMATIPATVGGDPPVVAFCAHLDTSPETSGAGVHPQVVANYGGSDLVLPADPSRVIRVAENPEMTTLIGRTLITSDGTTLLGADDKAGVAVIVESAVWLAEHPELRHGRVRLCFTCDEEIGRGVEHLDPGRLGACVCYTLDGQGAGAIDVETFSADRAQVTIRGVNIHPSIAKGRMTNALRVAADFLQRLPHSTLSPETSEGRQGFLHPYEIHGGVGQVEIAILLRDFQTSRLAELQGLLLQAAAATMLDYPAAKIEVDTVRQYRNMAEGLTREPRAVGYAQAALERLGRKAELTIVRGGTDGSRLTELGLPTPNLSTGEHNPHSPLEWACLEEMVQAVQWVIALTAVWGGN
jgi:tripeptide aminopeptidase